jgi:hypothetical protein
MESSQRNVTHRQLFGLNIGQDVSTMIEHKVADFRIDFENIGLERWHRLMIEICESQTSGTFMDISRMYGYQTGKQGDISEK